MGCLQMVAVFSSVRYKTYKPSASSPEWAAWKTQLFHDVEPTQERRWAGSRGEKESIFEMNLEEKECVLKLFSVGAESDQVVKLHPSEAEAGRSLGRSWESSL